MQNEIIKNSNLLSSNGKLIQKGWAKKLLLQYDRKAIKAPKFKIKEWDYYCILTNTHGISFTVADNGYLGFIACTLFDFKEAKEMTKNIMTPFPLGSFNMPESSEKGNIEFKNKEAKIQFIIRDNIRELIFDFKNFADNKSLKGKIELFQNPEMDTMVIATPFAENSKAFYYNQKINCMPAKGEFLFGDNKLSFDNSSAMGVLDWGRGVWTYSNTWYWGSASGLVNGIPFGFNIGYGFGDTSKATENMIFYAGKAHKLDIVTFEIHEEDYLKPWRFYSNDGRFEMKFEAILDRYSNTNVLIIQSKQHQVFGKYSGRTILDDGTVIEISNFLGFAEKVKNRW